MVVRTQNALEALYEGDETAWLDKMAELVSEGRLEELDYAHLEEYLADMAKRDRRAVESRLTLILEHLIKWFHQPDRRTGSWLRTIIVQQQKLAPDVVGGVLRNHAEAVLAGAYGQAIVRAAAATGLPAQTFAPVCKYTLDQIVTMKLTEE